MKMSEKTLAGAANSFFSTLIMNPSATTVKPFHRPGSPRSLALERNDMEREYIDATNRMNSIILEKEYQVKHWQQNSQNPNETLESLMSELDGLKKELADHHALKHQEALDLDMAIGLQQSQELEEIKQVSARFKRIVVALVPGDLQRILKPVCYYCDLQSQLESIHPGFNVALSVPGTSQVVGSQFELMCAYQDTEGDILHLNLNLTPITPKKKRDLDASENGDEEIFIRHAGRWSNAEIQLFQAGVQQYGWGQWSKIASTIETRDRDQVRKFSLNQKAKKFKSSVSLIPIITDLANGFKVVAHALEIEIGDDQEE